MSKNGLFMRFSYNYLIIFFVDFAYKFKVNRGEYSHEFSSEILVFDGCVRVSFMARYD